MEFDTLTRLVTCADIDGLTKLFKATKDATVLKNVLKSTDCTALKGTLLHIACAVGNESLGILLVESGAPINTPDEIRNTTLHIAAVGGLLDLVRAMCEAGGNVFARNYRNFTPLQEATLEYKFVVSLYLSEVMQSKNLVMWPSILAAQEENISNSEITKHSSVCEPYTRSKVVEGANICASIPGDLIPQSISFTSGILPPTQSVTCTSNTVEEQSSPVNSGTSFVLDTAVQRMVDSWLVKDPQPIMPEIH